jgi:hypothetical protein
MRNAVVAALVSALVSASGTYAASRVLITSTHQIAPPVLAQLAKLKARTAYVQGAASKVSRDRPGSVRASPVLPACRGPKGCAARPGSKVRRGARSAGSTSTKGPP